MGPQFSGSPVGSVLAFRLDRQAELSLESSISVLVMFGMGLVIGAAATMVIIALLRGRRSSGRIA
jgi:hypothetical protein